MKINWGVSIGLVYLLFVAGMIAIAIKSSSQKLELVADNYYDDAVHYQDKINAVNNTTSGECLNIDYVEKENGIVITIPRKSERINSGVLSFYKPDDATEDFKMDFLLDASGQSFVPLKNMSHGYWKVTGTWAIGDKNFYQEKRIFIP
jgi:nitrogen fixation protein FixH